MIDIKEKDHWLTLSITGLFVQRRAKEETF